MDIDDMVKRTPAPKPYTVLEPVAIPAASVAIPAEWRAAFTEREQKEIAFSLEYYMNYRHGTTGHNDKMLIARLASLLDGQRVSSY